MRGSQFSNRNQTVNAFIHQDVCNHGAAGPTVIAALLSVLRCEALKLRFAIASPEQSLQFLLAIRK
jgi:hypothetical protein